MTPTVLIKGEKNSTGLCRSGFELQTFGSEPVTLVSELRHFFSVDKGSCKFCILVVALGKATSLLVALPSGSRSLASVLLYMSS
jgi:hypothetical protein